MDDLISTLIWLIVGFYAVKFALRINDVIQHSNELEERIKAHLHKIVHSVKIEQHNDIYYWYDNDDDSFLAQGRGTEEIVAVLKSRFPEHIFLINNESWVAASTDWKLSKELGDIEKIHLSI